MDQNTDIQINFLNILQGVYANEFENENALLVIKFL